MFVSGLSCLRLRLSLFVSDSRACACVSQCLYGTLVLALAFPSVCMASCTRTGVFIIVCTTPLVLALVSQCFVWICSCFSVFVWALVLALVFLSQFVSHAFACACVS